MHTSSAFIFALAAATSVLASPAPFVKRDPEPEPEPKILYLKDVEHATTSGTTPEKRAITECQAVNAVVGALKAVSKVAYPFCSSYISIPVVTSTNTATTTVTPSPVSVTATVTPVAETTTTTTTVTSTVTSGTATIYSRYTPAAAAKEKRAGPTLPAYVAAFGAAQVSKACSCLSIPASTTTTATTVSTTLPANTITATVTAAAATNTVTSTVTTTTTVASTATLPALCAPSILSQTSGALGSSSNNFPSQSIKPAGNANISTCCTACFNTQGCLSYYLYQGQCTVFTSVSQATPNQANAAQQALCPLGLNNNDSIFPDGVSAPAEGDDAFHIGPCVRDATPII